MESVNKLIPKKEQPKVNLQLDSKKESKPIANRTDNLRKEVEMNKALLGGITDFTAQFAEQFYNNGVKKTQYQIEDSNLLLQRELNQLYPKMHTKEGRMEADELIRDNQYQNFELIRSQSFRRKENDDMIRNVTTDGESRSLEIQRNGIEREFQYNVSNNANIKNRETESYIVNEKTSGGNVDEGTTEALSGIYEALVFEAGIAQDDKILNAGMSSAISEKDQRRFGNLSNDINRKIKEEGMTLDEINRTIADADIDSMWVKDNETGMYTMSEGERVNLHAELEASGYDMNDIKGIKQIENSIAIGYKDIDSKLNALEIMAKTDSGLARNKEELDRINLKDSKAGAKRETKTIINESNFLEAYNARNPVNTYSSINDVPDNEINKDISNGYIGDGTTIINLMDKATEDDIKVTLQKADKDRIGNIETKKLIFQQLLDKGFSPDKIDSTFVYLDSKGLLNNGLGMEKIENIDDFENYENNKNVKYSDLITKGEKEYVSLEIDDSMMAKITPATVTKLKEIGIETEEDIIKMLNGYSYAVQNGEIDKGMSNKNIEKAIRKNANGFINSTILNGAYSDILPENGEFRLVTGATETKKNRGIVSPEKLEFSIEQNKKTKHLSSSKGNELGEVSRKFPGGVLETAVYNNEFLLSDRADIMNEINESGLTDKAKKELGKTLDTLFFKEQDDKARTFVGTAMDHNDNISNNSYNENQNDIDSNIARNIEIKKDLNDKDFDTKDGKVNFPGDDWSTVAEGINFVGEEVPTGLDDRTKWIADQKESLEDIRTSNPEEFSALIGSYNLLDAQNERNKEREKFLKENHIEEKSDARIYDNDDTEEGLKINIDTQEFTDQVTEYSISDGARAVNGFLLFPATAAYENLKSKAYLEGLKTTIDKMFGTSFSNLANTDTTKQMNVVKETSVNQMERNKERIVDLNKEIDSSKYVTNMQNLENLDMKVNDLNKATENVASIKKTVEDATIFNENVELKQNIDDNLEFIDNNSMAIEDNLASIDDYKSEIKEIKNSSIDVAEMEKGIQDILEEADLGKSTINEVNLGKKITADTKVIKDNKKKLEKIVDKTSKEAKDMELKIVNAEVRLEKNKRVRTDIKNMKKKSVEMFKAEQVKQIEEQTKEIKTFEDSNKDLKADTKKMEKENKAASKKVENNPKGVELSKEEFRTKRQELNSYEIDIKNAGNSEVVIDGKAIKIKDLDKKQYEKVKGRAVKGDYVDPELVEKYSKKNLTDAELTSSRANLKTNMDTRTRTAKEINRITEIITGQKEGKEFDKVAHSIASTGKLPKGFKSKWRYAKKNIKEMAKKSLNPKAMAKDFAIDTAVDLFYTGLINEALIGQQYQLTENRMATVAYIRAYQMENIVNADDSFSAWKDLELNTIGNISFDVLKKAYKLGSYGVEVNKANSIGKESPDFFEHISPEFTELKEMVNSTDNINEKKAIIFASYGLLPNQIEEMIALTEPSDKWYSIPILKYINPGQMIKPYASGDMSRKTEKARDADKDDSSGLL